MNSLPDERAPRLHPPPVELDQPADEREPDAEPALRAVERVRACMKRSTPRDRARLPSVVRDAEQTASPFVRP